MGRFAAILLAVSGTVALQVLAQTVVLASVRFIGHRTRGAAELRRTFWFSLVTFATLGYGDIVLSPGYRIFGALGATCGSLMLGWSTALIFADISRART